MGLYNFQKRFIKPILSGNKTHTIRAIRVHPDKPGDTLHLYTGLRTKKAKLLMRVKCIKVEEIRIQVTFEMDGPDKGKMKPQVWIGEPGALWVALSDRKMGRDAPIHNGDCVRLALDEREALARRDGFASFQEMMQFWTEPKNRLPFHGNVIHWRKL